MAAGSRRQPCADPAMATAGWPVWTLLATCRYACPLASDRVNLVEGKLTFVARKLSQWRDLALSTDFTSALAAAVARSGLSGITCPG